MKGRSIIIVLVLFIFIGFQNLAVAGQIQRKIKRTNTIKINDPRPDFIVDKVKTFPGTSFLGDPYVLKVWLKKYPVLKKPVRVNLKTINTREPIFLINERVMEIPTVWDEKNPQLEIEFKADDIKIPNKQQMKKIFFTFDPSKQVDEKNESNNTQTKRYRIYDKNIPLPDLVFLVNIRGGTYFKSESSGYQKGVNQPVKCWGEIHNQGKAVAKNFMIRVTGTEDMKTQTKFTQLVRFRGNIKPGETKTFSFYKSWKTSGSKVLFFELDHDNRVVESLEENNNAKYSLTVKIK